MAGRRSPVRNFPANWCRQGHRVSILRSAVAGREYLEVPLDRPVIEQGVEIRYFSALARPDKYMFSPKLWSALGETVGQFDVVHIWSVYGFFNVGRSLLVPQAPGCRTSSFRTARSIPICGAATARESGSYQAFCRARVPQGFGDYVQYQRRNASGFGLVGLATGAGGNGSLPKRYVVPIGLDPGWFREPDSRRWPKIPAAVSGAAGTPPGGLFRAAQLQEGARPSGPCLCPDRGRLRRRAFGSRRTGAMKITSAR